MAKFEKGNIPKNKGKGIKYKVRVCLKCGSDFTSANKNARFCCKGCATSYRCAGRSLSEEQKEQISTTMKKKHLSPPDEFKFKKGFTPWNKGCKFSELHRQHIRDALTGKKQPEETKEKRRQHMLNNPVKYWEGKRFSLEHRQKISAGNRGKVLTEEVKQKMRESTCERLGGRPASIGQHEASILSWLEMLCGYEIERQKRVAGFFLDGYCNELNMAIEIDEPHHRKTAVVEKDKKRERLIRKKLNCMFLRIPVYG